MQNKKNAPSNIHHRLWPMPFNNGTNKGKSHIPVGPLYEWKTSLRATQSDLCELVNYKQTTNEMYIASGQFQHIEAMLGLSFHQITDHRCSCNRSNNNWLYINCYNLYSIRLCFHGDKKKKKDQFWKVPQMLKSYKDIVQQLVINSNPKTF